MRCARLYRRGTVYQEDVTLAEVSTQLDLPDTVAWIDFLEPSEEQLSDLARTLVLHELAVADTSSRQRPKLARYATHLFLSCHAARVDAGTGTLELAEVSVLFSRRWLVTVRKDPAFRIEAILERWDRSPDLAVNGVGYLLYGLLDVVVDGYFDVTEALDEFYERVGEGMFTDQRLGPDRQREWFVMTRTLSHLHRLVVPMREVSGSLVRREHSFATDELVPYFQDVHDHVVGVIDDLNSLRQVAATIMDTDVNLRDHRQNVVMKQVSSWAAIIAIPTLVTGFYGMNVPYPGSGEGVGVVTATGVMIIACLALYHVFRRNSWL